MSKAQHSGYYRIVRCIEAIKRKFDGDGHWPRTGQTGAKAKMKFANGGVHMYYEYAIHNKNTDEVMKDNWIEDGRGRADVVFVITNVDPIMAIGRSFDITQPDACLAFIERTLQEYDVIPRTHVLPLRYEAKRYDLGNGHGIPLEHVSDPPKEEPLAN